MIERKGDWMQTATGSQFWPCDPRPEDIHIEDIAHALSLICRFNGHCRGHYSVAQHSVLVSDALPRELALWGLLHDASEAYIADVPRPLKPFLTNYRDLEDAVMLAVCERFGLSPEMPAEVKRVDNAILADEAIWCMDRAPAPWNLPEPALGVAITPWTWRRARHRFLTKFHGLTGN